MSSITPEFAAYLILGLVDRYQGSTERARAHIEAKKAEGKSFDQILDDMQAESLAAKDEAHKAVDAMK